MFLLIPAVHKPDSGYRDLEVLLTSFWAYGSRWDKAVIAWKGPEPPQLCLPEQWQHDTLEWVRQPDDAQHFGDAARCLLEWLEGPHVRLDYEDLLWLNDDTVLTPWTLETLVGDLVRLRQEPRPVGLVGLRSNFVAGAQNIRQPNGAKRIVALRWESEDEILGVPLVFGVGMAVRRSALERVSRDWTRTHWYGDNLLSFDLRELGYQHFVSRAYVHHHGSRSTASWEAADRDSKAWLIEHRPDFAASYGWL